MSIDAREFLPSGNYIVCAKADDPLSRPARARLIWAANTAQATMALGVKTILVGGAQDQGFPVESFAGLSATKRRIAALYGVNTDFEIRTVSSKRTDPERVYAEYPINVLPHAGLVHTRDPRIAALCSKRSIPFILEFHDEDYQDPAHWEGIDFSASSCKAAIAITTSVAAGLMSLGLPKDKILVQNSGANGRAATDRFQAASRWREALLDGWFERLVVYSGGLQTERGVEHIMWAAKALPNYMFVLCGGHQSDISRLESLLRACGVTNVKLPGYMPFENVCEIQQAADVLLFTRSAASRAAVTSPLKFFEYLLSGRPIVSAGIPALQTILTHNLDTFAYEAGSSSSLIDAIAAAVANRAWGPERSLPNITLGLDYVWEARQRRIMNFVGPVSVRTTF